MTFHATSCYNEIDAHGDPVKGNERQVQMVAMVLPEKQVYSIRELIENLPTSIRKLAEDSGVNEVTIAAVRDGTRRFQRKTVNRLLNALSQIYSRPFTLENVTGIELEQKTAWNKGVPGSTVKKSRDQEGSNA